MARVEALMAQTDNMVEPALAGPAVQEVQAQEIRGPAAQGPAAKEVLPEKLWLPHLAEQALSVLQRSPQPFR